MESDIRIVCIQIAPVENGGSVSVASSGRRSDIKTVLQRAMAVVEPTAVPYQAHLEDLERRALTPGKAVDVPHASEAASLSVARLLSEAEPQGQGGIVKTVA